VRPDVAVVGAGPAGYAIALAFTDAGAETKLFESVAPATRRLAGEWLHPVGVHALERLGVDLSRVRHCRAAGFIVHPEDGSTPITLTYPKGGRGLSCHHESLLQGLRAALTQRPGGALVRRARIIEIAGRSLVYASGPGPAAACRPAGWLVGAEGKTSAVRRSLGIPSQLTCLSHMAGLLLEDAELPEEDYGHILWHVVHYAHDLFGRAQPEVRVRSYPVTAKHGLIWIFPGDPALAPSREVPDIRHAGGPQAGRHHLDRP
jgi:squalene monooxygenase